MRSSRPLKNYLLKERALRPRRMRRAGVALGFHARPLPSIAPRGQAVFKRAAARKVTSTVANPQRAGPAVGIGRNTKNPTIAVAPATATAIFLSTVMANMLLHCLHSLAPPGLDGPIMAGEKGLILAEQCGHCICSKSLFVELCMLGIAFSFCDSSLERPALGDQGKDLR